MPAGVIQSFRSHYGPGVDSASNRNEYQEYFAGGKGGRCVRLTTYHHPVPLSRNLGTLTSWNPLGLSRPVMGLLFTYAVIRILVQVHYCYSLQFIFFFLILFRCFVRPYILVEKFNLLHTNFSLMDDPNYSLVVMAFTVHVPCK